MINEAWSDAICDDLSYWLREHYVLTHQSSTNPPPPMVILARSDAVRADVYFHQFVERTHGSLIIVRPRTAQHRTQGCNRPLRLSDQKTSNVVDWARCGCAKSIDDWSVLLNQEVVLLTMADLVANRYADNKLIIDSWLFKSCYSKKTGN